MAASLKVYVYSNCDTCRRALKFLDAHGIAYQTVPIRETPPSTGELKRMLKHLNGEILKLFNTAGQDYRRLGLKDQVKSMKPEDAFALLTTNGNLVKRPFALGSGTGAVGFREDEWMEKFLA